MAEEPQQQMGRRKGPPPKPPAPITHSETISKILWATVRAYRDIFPNKHRVVFDDYEYLFTPDRIQMNESRGLPLFCEHPEKEGKRVNLQFTCLEFFDLDLSGDIDSNPNAQWTSIYLKNLLSQYTRYSPPDDADPHEIEVSKRFTHLQGGMFFVPRTPNAPKISIAPGVESWLGLYASVRRMENFDPVINLGLVNKLFVQLNLDLITFYLAIENDITSSRSLQQLELNAGLCMGRDQARRFNHKLENIKLKCDCAPGKDKDGIVTDRVVRHYRFVEVRDGVTADREFLNVEDSTAREEVVKEFRGKDGRVRQVRRRLRRVRMDEWYAAQGQPLKYPKLPLCFVKSGKKEDLIPMEVLFTHDQPQKYIKLLDFFTRMKIPRLLSRTPVQHHKFTNKMLNEKLESDKDPFMKAMKISLDPKMIECEGRVVEPCTVLAKSESDESVTSLDVKKESGEFFISRAMETTNKTIRFVVYKLTDAVRVSEVREFYQELVKKCVTRGFKVPESDHQKPPIWKDEVIGDDELQLARLIQGHLEQFEKSGKSDDECLVFLFFTKMSDDLYGEIKYLSDIRYGVVSQVVDVGTVKKACTKSEGEIPSDYKSVYHHICLKLNAKLGGVNQIVAESDEPEYGRMPSNERTMFIGIDVIHPSPNSPIRDLSLAAIVASMDKNAAKYSVRIKVNSKCNESVQQFDEHFSCLLAKYHAVNGFLPDRVVILRDGVSDSEMVKAASLELNSLKVAWRKCANGRKCPPFTYIVAQKRHKTRFYRRPDEENGDVKNPPMGTIVDRAVVTPHMFDFYMVSHYTLIGTSRPIHYTVVYDDCNSSSDEIQELVFRLCFLYARCSKPVSIPSPVYYAHLACERAAFQHQYAIRTGEVNEILDQGETESVDAYSSRVGLQALIIEKKLQVSEKHPGMYFI